MKDTKKLIESESSPEEIVNKISEARGFRRFDKMDWDGYGGAEPFPDGSDPLIAELDDVAYHPDASAQIIIDGTGVEVDIWGRGGGPTSWFLDTKTSSNDARKFGWLLNPSNITPENLKSKGFKNI